MPEFTHLHVHSQYSVLDGATKLKDLISKCKEYGMSSVALTDHGSMFGVKEFHNIAIKAGIKPILGCEFYISPDSRFNTNYKKGNRTNYHLILLAKNEEGYKNLMKLASYAWTEGFYYKPRIDKELLHKYSNGIIASSACLGGEIPTLIRQGNIKQAENVALEYKEIFGDDYYLELMRHKTGDPLRDQKTYDIQELVNKELVRISEKLNIKYIATNDVHFLNKEDAEAHDILICLNTKKDLNDPNRMRYTGQEYFKSPEEMADLFSDYPEALANTMEIAEKVEEYKLDKDPIMPIFNIPDNFKDDNEYLKHLVFEGAKERWGENIDQEIKERLDFELDTITKMGFASYFLIVWDFIKEARDMNISVGPGRGSAAGSAIAYCLKITNIDPIKYNLLFERFLNPDRISMPDIDIDFDEDGRDDILRRVAKKYGEKRVAHICTFGTMATKMAIRDVGRVLGVPLYETDRIAKMVPDKAKNIKDAYEKSKELKEIRENAEGQIAKMLDFVEVLEGNIRQTGVHACGTIIGRDDLENYIPLMKANNADLYVTQYEGTLVEPVGLLKMDFLGLRTLSIIKDALENIKLSTGKDIDIDAIDFTDKKTFELFSNGNTTGVFQFESDGMKKHLRNLKPNRFEDLIAMNALYRPGPMEYIDDFIARKHGLKKIEYQVPEMEEYLSETYGITVYQEQVMLLSRKLAGFTRGEADLLRKAMGKKKKDLLDTLQPKFYDGCQNNGISKEMAEKIWNDWEAFASYAFNKSHSTCYAYLAFQTGYLKANYPAEYMAAVMSRNYSQISKISFFMEDCKNMGIDVLGPDINESYDRFTVNKKGQIRFGMKAIKGVGEGPVEEIIKERDKNGMFQDIYDFVERVNLNTINKRVLEALVLSGGLDSISQYSREKYFTPIADNGTFLESLLHYGSIFQNEKNSSTNSIFGNLQTKIEIKKPEPINKANEWTDLEKLKKEKEYIGIYLSSHPLESDKIIIETKTNTKLSELNDINKLYGKDLYFAGIVNSVNEKFTKTGKPWASISIEDFSGNFSFALFSKQYIEFKNKLSEGYKVFISARYEKSPHNEEIRLNIKNIQMLDELQINSLVIKLPVQNIHEDLIKNLKQTFEKNKGESKLEFIIFDAKSNTWIQMYSQNIKVNVNNQLINQLTKLNLDYKLY